MSHLPPAHHETSKCDSPNETKVKEKQNETIPDSNSNRPKRPRKTQEGHLEEGKLQKPIKDKKSGKAKQKWQKRAKKSSEEQEKLKLKPNAQNQHKRSKSILPLKSTPPNTLNASSPPLR
jgi:hypothetical protein